MPIEQALKIAQEMELDLVEISPKADPPVCKVIDYKKFLYEHKKKQKEIKSKQSKVSVKEIRFGPNTDEHDQQFKLKHARKFLEEGSKVKAFVFMGGYFPDSAACPWYGESEGAEWNWWAFGSQNTTKRTLEAQGNHVLRGDNISGDSLWQLESPLHRSE